MQPETQKTATVFIIATSQIAKPDNNKTIDAFTKLMQEQSKFPYLCSLRVQLAWLLDTIWYGTISKYKSGKIDDAEFRERLSNQLGIKTDSDKFDTAWNTMCTISEDAFKRLLEINELQKKHGFKLEAAGASNKLQAEYITKQLQNKGFEIPITSVHQKPGQSFKDVVNAVAEKYDIKDNKIFSLIDIAPTVKNATFTHAPCKDNWADKIKEQFATISGQQI